MPVKHLIGPGIGFSPGSVKYIVTRGLTIGAITVYVLGDQRATFARFRDSRDYAEHQDRRDYVRVKIKRSFDDG